MTKEKCENCNKEFKSLSIHQRTCLSKEAPKTENSNVEETLGAIMTTLQNFNRRLDNIENKGANEFRYEVKKEDIEKAKSGREGIDPRIVKIVDEILGEDFRIDIDAHKDKPGFLFTLVVPQRLSELKPQSRPVKDEKGEYKKDDKGNVIEEDYFPDDKRSRAISSTQSYDAIKEHCSRVRSNIVSYYQKVRKPIPEFKLRIAQNEPYYADAKN